MEEFSQKADEGSWAGFDDPFSKKANLSALKRRLQTEKLQKIMEKNQDEEEPLGNDVQKSTRLSKAKGRTTSNKANNGQQSENTTSNTGRYEMQLEHAGSREELHFPDGMNQQHQPNPASMAVKNASMQRLKVLASVAPGQDVDQTHGEVLHSASQRMAQDVKKFAKPKSKRLKPARPLELIAEEEHGEHNHMLEEPLPAKRAQDGTAHPSVRSKLLPIEKGSGRPNKVSSKTDLMAPMRNSRDKALEQCQDIKEKQKEKHAGILENAKRSIYPVSENSNLSGGSGAGAMADERRATQSRHKHVETVMDQVRNQRNTQLGSRKPALNPNTEIAPHFPEPGTRANPPRVNVGDKKPKEFRPTGQKIEIQGTRSIRNSEMDSRDESVGGSTLRNPSIASGMSQLTSTLTKMRQNGLLSQTYTETRNSSANNLTLDVVSRLRAQGGIGDGQPKLGIVLVDKPPVGMSKLKFETRQLQVRQCLLDIPDLIRQMAQKGDQSFSIDVSTTDFRAWT